MWSSTAVCFCFPWRPSLQLGVFGGELDTFSVLLLTYAAVQVSGHPLGARLSPAALCEAGCRRVWVCLVVPI